MRSAFRAAALGVASVAAALAQTPSQTTAIAGRVMDPTTGRPVAGATVHLYARTQRTTTSDSSGSFVFEDVGSADYTLYAESDAGLGRYGATRANGGGRTLHVQAGARVESATIPLWPLGGVEGRVLDERGDPLGGIDVQLEPSESGTSVWAKTAPDGRYRARHLLPGTYVAVVDNWLHNLPLDPYPPPGASSGTGGYPFLIDSDRRTLMLAALRFASNADEGHPRLFVTSVYSKGRTGRAEPIRIAGGEVHRGIDIIVGARTGVRVAGTLTTPSGPVSGGIVALRRSDIPEYVAIWGLRAGARPDGTFAFVAVPPGRYRLTAYRQIPSLTMARLDEAGRPVTGTDHIMMPDESDYSLEGSLDVGTTDVSNLTLSMHPGTTVSGTLTVDGHAPEDGKTACAYLLSLVKRRLDDVRVGCRRADGTFTLKARPGPYAVTAGPASKDWAFDGMSIGGREIAETAITVGPAPIGNLDVKLTSRRRGVAGTVVMPNGSVPDLAGVIVFPRERQWWTRHQLLYNRLLIYPDRENRTRTRDGRFEFLGLRPGEYFVAAVDADVFADPVTPAMLKRLARNATRVTVAESGVTTVTLRLQ